MKEFACLHFYISRNSLTNVMLSYMLMIATTAAIVLIMNLLCNNLSRPRRKCNK
jgi:hypothetical protein